MIPTSLMKLFGRSPISPLQKHMLKAHECVEKLEPFFTAVLDEDWAQAEKHQKQIASLEGDADVIKRDIRLHLPKSLFLPVSRNDILELLIAQDSIPNRAKDIAGLVIGRKMIFPKTLKTQLLSFVKCSINASAQAAKAINELTELFETGFRGSELIIIHEMIQKLGQVENESDELQKKIRHELFMIEKEMHPIDAIFLYKIIEWIGGLADRAQHVGGKLQLLLAR